MAIKKEGLERVGLRLPAEVKEWYMKESLSLGLTMSQYMSFVLVNYKRQQENVDVLKSITEMSKDTGLKETNKELIEIMKSDVFKQTMKEIQDFGKKKHQV